jgi:hypothetical protein
METLYASLARHDSNGQGYLTKSEIEGWLWELTGQFCQLQALDPPFVPIWIFTASATICFFFDADAKGRVSIQELLQSSVRRFYSNPLANTSDPANNNCPTGSCLTPNDSFSSCDGLIWSLLEMRRPFLLEGENSHFSRIR